ncbi:MAG: GntR family transcriptional regulator [Chloroflexota bacterium]
MPQSSQNANQPRYQQLANHFRQQIETGLLKANDQLAPEIDLAEQFNVSRGTIRQALDLLVHQGLLERTRGRGTFVTPLECPPPTTLIGVIIPHLQDPLSTEILRGVDYTLRDNNCSVVFGHSEDNLELEQHYITTWLREGIQGLILFPTADEEESTFLTQHIPPDLPLVIVDRNVSGVTADSVVVDNRGGAYLAVQYLLEMGHHRIACITQPNRPSSIVERIDGYEQALRDACILPLSPIHIPRFTNWSENNNLTPLEKELALIDHLLTVRERPTALFCINDYIACTIMRHLLARSVRIPEDLSLIGFDNLPLTQHLPVPLTTVAQPRYEIGQQAAAMLIEQLRGTATSKRRVMLPTQLVIRDSTCPPAS